METEHSRYKFDDFELDVPKRRLLRDGKVIALNPKAFDLLAVLIRHNGELLTKDDLFRMVWDEQIVEESNLTVNMSAIRKALGEKASEPRYITTVSGRGYYFTANLKSAGAHESSDFDENSTEKNGGSNKNSVNQEIADFSAQKQTEISLPISASPEPDSVLKRNSLAIFAAAALAILFVGGYFFYRAQASKNYAQFQQISFKRLATTGKVTNAALAPDGKLFVYSRQEPDGKQSLWLEHIDGGEQKQVLAPADVTFLNIAFAPDGSRLFYQTTDGQLSGATLFKIPVFGGLSEKVREGVANRIAFSPDGKQFAFVKANASARQSELVIAETDGSGERVIFSRESLRGIISSSVAWSRDGKLIAFSANNDDSGTNQDVFAVRADDGAIEKVTDSMWNNVRALVWAKDGSGLFAVAGDKDSVWDSQIWRIAYPGGEAQRIVTDLVSYSSVLDMSAEGDKLLGFQAQQLSNIWVAPADNLSAAKQITFDSLGKLKGWNGLEWTPDGRIVLTGFVGKSETLLLMDSNGANQKQIIPEKRINVNPSISSDGRILIFDSNRSGSSEIWRSDADGANMRQLTSGGRNSQPHVSPDGKFVIYRSTNDGAGALWRISSDGGEPVRLTHKTAEWARYSPDGKMIAYGFSAEGKAKIAVISGEGGEPQKTFDLPRTANLRLGIHWTPDGASLTFRDWASGIWRQPLSGGEPQRLEGLPEEKLYGYGWSRDGKYFAFTRGTEIRDVVLLIDAR